MVAFLSSSIINTPEFRFSVATTLVSVTKYPSWVSHRDQEDGFFLCVSRFVFRRKAEDSASLPESSTFQ